MKLPLLGIAAACIILSPLEGAVIVQTFDRPLAPTVTGIPPRSNFSYLVNGVRHFFDWRQVPLAIDMDGNGTTEFTIISERIVLSVMQVTMRGTNQLWSETGGFSGHDLGSDAVPILGGTMIGPSLTSGTSSIGWHNELDTRAPSTLMATFQGSPVGGYFFPSYPFEQKYMGIRFKRNGATHYGWVAISGYQWLGEELYIHSWAWESEPNTPLAAGVIPEPGARDRAAGCGRRRAAAAPQETGRRAGWTPVRGPG